jgi:hypothetical protein
VRAAGDPVLAEQYARWWTALDEEQVIDRGRMRIAVIEALRTDVAAWPSGEALFAQGFDDLSPAQEELLRLVAQRAEVVLSLTYEAGRAPFQVLTPVVGRLAELAGPDGILELPAAAFARQPDLIALERRFGEPAPDARCAASTTGGVALFEAEGERGEAELVTREVAEALRDGTPGHRIAVIACGWFANCVRPGSRSMPRRSGRWSRRRSAVPCWPCSRWRGPTCPPTPID